MHTKTCADSHEKRAEPHIQHTDNSFIFTPCLGKERQKASRDSVFRTKPFITNAVIYGKKRENIDCRR